MMVVVILSYCEAVGESQIIRPKMLLINLRYRARQRLMLIRPSSRLTPIMRTAYDNKAEREAALSILCCAVVFVAVAATCSRRSGYVLRVVLRTEGTPSIMGRLMTHLWTGLLTRSLPTARPRHRADCSKRPQSTIFSRLETLCDALQFLKRPHP